jgi:IDEAL domain
MDGSQDDLVRDVRILQELIDDALERKDETLFYACSQLLTDRRFELAGLGRAARRIAD